jgi:3,4-dihydroxy 2-butanone 4-phosphate synthase/GTP cyclohydrolase II
MGVITPIQVVRRREPLSTNVRHHIGFPEVEAAIKELRAGRMVIVVDGEDRENEGDLLIAADSITPAAINFMAIHGRGLICLAMTEERLDELDLGPMCPMNTARTGTAFSVSIDTIGRGVTTGISCYDRAQTIRAAIDPRSKAEDFGRPGHVFPLRARPHGVLERPGHTEAAIDLTRLAGLYPSGVICEIMKDDGNMARLPDLIAFAATYSLRTISIAELIKYRRESDYQWSSLES